MQWGSRWDPKLERHQIMAVVCSPFTLRQDSSPFDIMTLFWCPKCRKWPQPLDKKKKEPKNLTKPRKSIKRQLWPQKYKSWAVTSTNLQSFFVHGLAYLKSFTHSATSLQETCRMARLDKWTTCPTKTQEKEKRWKKYENVMLSVRRKAYQAPPSSLAPPYLSWYPGRGRATCSWQSITCCKETLDSQMNTISLHPVPIFSLATCRE